MSNMMQNYQDQDDDATEISIVWDTGEEDWHVASVGVELTSTWEEYHADQVTILSISDSHEVFFKWVNRQGGRSLFRNETIALTYGL